MRSAAAVRVPCSTSNLGSGFDTLGLALDRYLTLRFEPATRGGLELERTGTLTSLDVPPEEDLAVRAFRAVVEAGGRAPAGTLVLESEIPLARGLGSSAAALVGGHALGRIVLGLPPDARAAFQAAARAEGHGDNAAPCALGGLQAVARGDGGVFRALSLELSPDIGVAYAAPAERISTREARTALPGTVTHDVAVRGLGRLAALIRGLAAGDPELVRLGVQDELHVPYRLPLIPGAPGAMAAGYDSGAWAVTISGAGSGLVALCGRDDAPAVARAMGAVLAPEGGPAGGVACALRPDAEGVRVL